MLVDFDPVIFSIGPVAIRWYGMMYVIGFLIGVKILNYLARQNYINMPAEKADVLLTYLLIGMFVCARLFYVFIYNWEATHSFMDVIAVWRGGLSFHGAAIGFIIASGIFARRNGLSHFLVLDAIVLCTPQGLFWGRLGNFINGELYGRVTDSPIGMVFASDPERLVRHPSQLYQALTEGILLMLILWFLKPRIKKVGVMGPCFLVGYGAFRYITEFFRQPDSQLGYYFGGTTTMGQILCLLMVLAGVVIMLINLKRGVPLPQIDDSVKLFDKEEMKASGHQSSNSKNNKKNKKKRK
jgi:phosphatidylglycerol---prolipoprotein diacylglyceryl transferase